MILGVCQGKGGTGKTLTAINIAHALTRRKKTVLLIDLDPQSSLTYALGKQDTNSTIADVLLEQLPPAQAITNTSISGLYLLSGSSRLSNYDLQKATAIDRTSCIKKALKGIASHYDFVLLDSSPTLSLLNVAVITACDSLIVPVKPDYLSVQSLAGFLQSIEEAKENLDCTAKVLGVLPVMIDKRLKSQKEMLRLLQAKFGKQVFKAHIPNSVKLSEAPSHGKSIFEYAPTSIGAIQYDKVTTELLKRLK